MDKQDFIDAGYQRFAPPPYNECATDLFEKCIRDDKGKKYFIHVYVWDFSMYEKIPTGIRFESEVNLVLNDGNDNYVQIKMLNGWHTIEEMEQYYRNVWDTGMYKYYEEY